MGKSTYGMGSLTLRGKKWYGYPRIRQKDPVTGQMIYDRRPIILGIKSGMTKTKAREKLAREIAKRKGWFRTNGQVMNDGSVTLGWFVRNRYLPLKEGDRREETAKNKTSLIQTNLLDDLGELPLVSFDRFTLQMHVNKLAETCSKDTVLQIRAYLRDILEEAVDQDFLSKNPSARVKVPKNLRATDTTTLTWDQLRMALELLDESDRILVELDMTDALRPSELFAAAVEVLRARQLPAGPTGDGIPGQDPSLRENPQRVSRRFIFHRCWSLISLPGKRSVRIHFRTPSSFRTRTEAFLIRATTASAF